MRGVPVCSEECEKEEEGGEQVSPTNHPGHLIHCADADADGYVPPQCERGEAQREEPQQELDQGAHLGSSCAQTSSSSQHVGRTPVI